jgi:thiosulfate/3-mercaptopyruvate sulfurtransferase
MEPRTDPIVSAHDLDTLPALVLLDARSGPNARDEYEHGHLAGARHVDLDNDLATRPADARNGGRHPLPTPAAFAATLGRLGVTPASTVVVYDDQGGANAAARAWWMLCAIGHRSVYVLDGGLRAALAAGRTLSTAPAPTPGEAYPARDWLWPLASCDEVNARRLDPRYCVLDVRAAARYRGVQEPIDPIAGHIPGAVNLPFGENLTPDGRFRSAEELRAQYTALLGGVPLQHLFVHCGSGVTACHTLLALHRAGLSGARLYVGSWSEWCRRPELPREP